MNKPRILFIGLAPFNFCPKPGLKFQTSYGVLFYIFDKVMREVIVHLVDIGGIVDHRCLNFLFIIYVLWQWYM